MISKNLNWSKHIISNQSNMNKKLHPQKVGEMNYSKLYWNRRTLNNKSSILPT